MDKEKLASLGYEEDEVVKILSDNGEEVYFIQIAGIAHAGNFYVIMQPIEPLEGMEEDDALVFKASRNEDGSEKFEIELDDSIIDIVYEEYCKLLDEAEGS